MGDGDPLAEPMNEDASARKDDGNKTIRGNMTTIQRPAADSTSE
jgi:hypothetical protein